MNLLKATGTIGGLTLVSRVAGFAREMLMARVLGAGIFTDAFYVAFRLPNTFRRLFGEGAFSAGFVPLYSQRLQSGGESEARHFSEEVLAVFLPYLPGAQSFHGALHRAELLVAANDLDGAPRDLLIDREVADDIEQQGRAKHARNQLVLARYAGLPELGLDLLQRDRRGVLPL